PSGSTSISRGSAAALSPERTEKSWRSKKYATVGPSPGEFDGGTTPAGSRGDDSLAIVLPYCSQGRVFSIVDGICHGPLAIKVPITMTNNLQLAHPRGGASANVVATATLNCDDGAPDESTGNNSFGNLTRVDSTRSREEPSGVDFVGPAKAVKNSSRCRGDSTATKMSVLPYTTLATGPSCWNQRTILERRVNRVTRRPGKGICVDLVLNGQVTGKTTEGSSG
ncbi:hypothetical protein THAOC_07911, partial [Thalassiosira oceanica]